MTVRSTASSPAKKDGELTNRRHMGKVCIFSHFDRDSIVRRYVLAYVEAIAAAGFSVMFVSTADRISTKDRALLEGLGADIHMRENKGIDFGSWQYGLNTIGDTEEISHLLLANDSVYGPFFDLGYLFDQMDDTDADFWGITDTYEGKWHLQSYFLCFNRNVVNSYTFREFFKRDFPSFTKRQTILKGEVGLSEELTTAGFRGLASCPYGALTEGKFGGLRNPTQHYWDELIENCGCPFLKILLVRDNPNGVQNVDRWRDVLRRATSYDITMIEDHLAAFREAQPGRSMIRLVFSRMWRLPYLAMLGIRAVAKASRHPIRTIMALEQFVEADLGKLPMHPGPHPRVAYINLESTKANSGLGDDRPEQKTAIC